MSEVSNRRDSSGSAAAAIAKNNSDDFQRVAKSYGMDSPAVDPGFGCMIIQDTGIAEDILWAIVVVNDAKMG